MKNFKVVKQESNLHHNTMRIHVTVPMDLFILLKESKILTNIDEIFSDVMLQYMYDEGFIEPVDVEDDEAEN